MQFLNALIHMLTVSTIDDQRALQEVDYVHTIGLFVLITALTTATTLATLGISLYVFKLLMGALSAHHASQFYMLLAIFVLGSILSLTLDFFAKCMGIYVREGLTSRFRTYLEKCYINNPTKVDINNNQRAFFESIEVASAHVPAMIKMSIIVSGYGVYAIYAFHPVLLLASALVGIVVQFINRAASKRLDDANSKEKETIQKVQMARAKMYHNREKNMGINAMNVQYHKMKAYIDDLYQVKTRLSINKALQDTLSKLVQALSNAFYYVYFSSIVFLGYLTLGEMFILLPFVEEIGRCAANLIALPMMIAPTRTSADNLIEIWNSLVSKKLKVGKDKILFEISDKRLSYYAFGSVVMFGGMQWFFTLPILKVINIVVFCLFQQASIFPKSTLAQLWIYCIKLLEYPFSSLSFEKEKEVAVDPEVNMSAQNTFCHLNERRYEFDPNIFSEVGIQVTGANEIGKSLVFCFFCGNNLYQNEKRVPGFFPSTLSMQLTPNTELYQEDGYLKSLAITFSVSERSLERYLEESLTQIGEISLTEKLESDRPSTGTQQLLYVLSGLYKSIEKHYQYICIDEALSGLSSDILDPAYQYIISQCKQNEIKLAVIHHGKEIEGLKQVIPDTSVEGITCFR